MSALNQDQVSRIVDQLAEIKNASLSIDLIDHVCCMIEEKVEEGLDVTAAENEVLMQMGRGRIKEIESETLYLTQNEVNMKKRTKIVGLIAIACILVGYTMKTLHLAGAMTMWSIGILLATFGFALLLFVDNLSLGKSTLLKISHLLGYLGASGIVLGFGFKFLHLQGASDMVYWSGFVLLIYFVLNNISSRSNVAPNDH